MPGFAPAAIEAAQLSSAKDDALVQRVGVELASLAYAAMGDAASAEALTPFGAADLVRSDGKRVLIDATATDNINTLHNDLQKLGLTEGATAGMRVAGWLPIRSIVDMAALDSLRFASASLAPVTFAGSATSQGADAIGAASARFNFGVDGGGTTVGVLSDSYDRSAAAITRATNDIASGDLPASVNVLSDAAAGADEGRAMLQVIHDIAPGANLAFHTAGVSEVDFAQGIRDLRDAGADVIVDDALYLTEPMFQDGIVAQAVDEVVGDGVAYFSAAGNSGTLSYESSFNSSGQPLFVGGVNTGTTAHDFDPTAGVDVKQQITIPGNTTIQIALQWDDPFASLGGSGAASDLDIYAELFGFVIGSSIRSNIGGDPWEVLTVANSNAGPITVDVSIGLSGGASPSLLKYVIIGDGTTIDEYATDSPTVFGHANAAGASTVGAAFYQNTPTFGSFDPLAQATSSLGGVDILFDETGARLASPETRQSVDIVAPDGGNNTFFGVDVDADSRPNFFGTSAAAAHAAGAAALLLAASGGSASLTPAALYDGLQRSTIDMDDPGTPGFDFGYDNRTGFGLIDVDAAMFGLIPFITGSAANDVFTVQRVGDQLEVYIGDVNPGNLQTTLSANSRLGLLMEGGAGVDQFNFISSVDGLAFPSGQIFIAGGPNSDTLNLTTAPAAETITVNPFDLSIGSQLLNFVEIEHVQLDGNGGVDTIIVDRDVELVNSQQLASLIVGPTANVSMACDSSATLDVASLNNFGTLDIGGAYLVVRGGDLNAVAGQIATAYNLGNWLGAGITSSNAIADSTYNAVGYATAADLGTSFGAATNLAPGDVLVRQTLYGDNNLDRSIDFIDLTLFITGFNGALSGWIGGDYDFDGNIDFDDLVFFIVAFNRQ